jgi:AhpD family alkylhydroperoxidase
MSHSGDIAEKRRELSALYRLIPDATQGFATLSKAVKEVGPLTLREKELVALGIAVAQCCKPCVDFHTEALMKAGASREDLGGALAMAIQMGGGPALMYAAAALACWDELAGGGAA